MDFENGVIVKIYKSWGALALPPNYDGHLLRTYDFDIVKTQRNSTQLNSKQLKSNFVGLDIVVTWNAYKPWNLHHKPNSPSLELT